MSNLVPSEIIERKILLIRSQKVILDQDIAELYGVETKALVRAVKRNLSRFPGDFMFQLTKEEFEHLRYQTGTSSQWGGRRYPPYAFAEQGVAMLSSVLRSERAIEVNIAIMRVFVRLREILSSHEDIRRKIESMEKKYDAQFRSIIEIIQRLAEQPEKPYKITGFTPGKK